MSEVKQQWIFIFRNHDLELRDKFVSLYGTQESTKRIMNKAFPNRWGFQYNERSGMKMLRSSNLIEYGGKL